MALVAAEQLPPLAPGEEDERLSSGSASQLSTTKAMYTARSGQMTQPRAG
ncbi:MAG: hypothetical protein IPL76_03975 [Gemmatimonadetes bacterium]|nr:hypothetical protein [Gemmatimonadota bacterium]